MPALIGPLGVRIEVEDAAVLAQLRAGRRELNQAVKRGLLAAAEEYAVPAVRALAPHGPTGRLEGSIQARSTTRSVYLTSSLRGKAGRFVGLLNYGGTVRVVIRTRRARALRLSDGSFRAAVSTPRVYPRRLFFERGRDAALPRIEARVANDVVDALAGAVLEVVA